MRVVTGSVALAGLLAASGALAAPPAAPLAAPPELTEQAIDAADFDGWKARADPKAKEEQEAQADDRRRRRGQKAKPPKSVDDAPDPFLIRAQILLDRAHASPGVIDGRDGDNFKKAVRAFETMRGLSVDGEIDPEVWTALSADGAKTTKVYVTTPQDLKGRYVKRLPADYAKLARLKWLGFRNPAEMLAERFHLAETLLRRLNPGATFKKAGEQLLVPDTGADPTDAVARIVVDKAAGELSAYAEDGRLVLMDPATVGSDDTPSPEGRMTVNKAYLNPVYAYDPKKNFQQGRNKRKLKLPPGPNGPVGSMWIDLSKDTYGIHGTPDPDKISKSGSHGCVRLTNWDAEALAKLVEPKKTEVEFR